VKIHSLLPSACIFVALTHASGALADEGVTTGKPQANRILEEVIVTARRKEENAQTVPVSIAVFSGQQIRDSGIQDTTQLQNYVPGVVFSGAGASTNTTFSIRGQGKDVIGPGLPSVVSYFNEVPMPSWGSILPTFDIQSIQVLKGPQGTLFGRNTTGGAVLVYSVPASYEFEGNVEMTAGNEDWYGIRGAVNFPLIDNKLALRVAADITRRDGYTKVVNRGTDEDDVHSDAFRASLLWDVNDNLQNSTVFDYQESKTNYPGVQIIGVTSNPPWAGTQIEPFFGCGVSVDCDVNLQFERQKEIGVRKTYSSVGSNIDAQYWGVSNTTIWQVGNIEIKNIFGYRLTDVDQVGEVDGTSLAVADQYSGTRNDEQFSDELQLSGLALNDRISWLVGGFWLDDSPSGSTSLALDLFRPAFLPLEVYTLIPGSPSTLSNTLYTDESYAVFGNVSYEFDSKSAILNKMTVNVGLRYTWDKQGVCSTVPQPITNKPVDSHSECKRTPGSFDESEEFSDGTYTLGLDYQVNDSLFLYVTNRSGYRAGGINTPELSLQLSPYQSYDPQKVNDIEIGAKSEWSFDNWYGRFNISFFEGEFTDLQRQITGITPGFADVTAENAPSNTALTINGGEAEIRGVEIEGVISSESGISISYAATYLDPKYTDQQVPPIFDSIAGDLDRFSNSPELSYSAGIAYDLPYYGELGRFAFNAHYSYTDTYYVDAAEVPDHEIVDISFHWAEILGRQFTATIFVNNAFDEDYIQNISSSSTGLGVLSGNYGPPRLYGLRVNYDF
jgi:iron complex outermembrane recepter protein